LVTILISGIFPIIGWFVVVQGELKELRVRVDVVEGVKKSLEERESRLASLQAEMEGTKARAEGLVKSLAPFANGETIPFRLEDRDKIKELGRVAGSHARRLDEMDQLCLMHQKRIDYLYEWLEKTNKRN
jgi:Tfp pilus assembly protein PilO